MLQLVFMANMKLLFNYCWSLSWLFGSYLGDKRAHLCSDIYNDKRHLHSLMCNCCNLKLIFMCQRWVSHYWRENVTPSPLQIMGTASLNLWCTFIKTQFCRWGDGRRVQGTHLEPAVQSGRWDFCPSANLRIILGLCFIAGFLNPVLQGQSIVCLFS